MPGGYVISEQAARFSEASFVDISAPSFRERVSKYFRKLDAAMFHDGQKGFSHSYFSPYNLIEKVIMNKLLITTTLAILLSACMFQKPDYVKSISANELKQVMEKGDIFLVDVHTPEQRHIKGTDAFIPYDDIENNRDKLPEDKSTPIYLYCEGGPMGNAAARTLHELGYHNLLNLEGGAKAWRQAGLAFQ